MDYGALPPELNSGRMYAGPGAESMLAAAAAWNGLAADLESAASSYGSVISALTSGPWVGPSSAAMAAAAAPYVAWMGATGQQAGLAAAQAQAAAAAYATAFAATVPPPEIAANRAQLLMLVATNFFGQNTPAIAATEAQYAEMWAQDAAAMYGYAATSAAATAQVTPFTAAPQTTNPAGVAAQAATSAQTAGASIGTGVQSALAQLMSTITTSLNSLASPLASALGVGSASGSAVTTPLGILSSNGLSVGGITSSLISEYAYLPGFFALSMTSSALGPLMNPDVFLPFMQMGGAGAAAAAPAALGSVGSDFAGGAGGFAGMGGWGSLAGIGQAASIGRLSVPPNWGWAATAPVGMMGSAPLGLASVPLAGNDVAAGLGFPIPFGGLGRAAAAGAAGGVAGAAAMKYLPRLNVVGRSPAAGYSAEPPAPPAAKYPPPAEFPTNGHAPPGYQAAVIYVPTNGHASTNGHSSTNGHKKIDV